MARFFITYFLLCLLSLHVQGQILDTNIQLSIVEVSESRLNQFNTGAKLVQLDSAQVQLASVQNLAEVLANSSQIYIKNYGPGRLASTSIRGASASHTALLWNGINLQNSFLGQVDLALFPSQASDQITLQYGGSSALYGSGAIGGSIHLNNLAQYNKKSSINISSNIASIGQFQNNLSYKVANAKWYSSTKLAFQKGALDFPVRTNTGAERKQENAALQHLSIFQNLSRKINQNNEVSLHLWWQDVDREIPPLRNQIISVAQQEDQAFRSTLNWKYTGQNYAQVFRIAYINESLLFRDSIADINSDSRSQNWVLESENRFYLSNQHRLNLGLHSTQIKAQSNNFDTKQNQNRSAIFLSWKYESKNQKWQHTLNLRQAIIDGTIIPFTPSLGFEWKFTPSLQLNGTVNRNYRIPTFNDQYFNPGGNPELQPEAGWSESLGLRFQKTIRDNQLKISTTLFNRNIENWIIWLPQSNFWSPENIQAVWSRGIENSIHWNRKINEWSFQANVQYDYVRSTNQKSKRPNDASIGKQLIYVPEHKIISNFSAGYKNWAFHVSQNYTGRVYLTSDNSSSLPSFWLSHLSLSKKIQARKFELDIHAKVLNLWDKDYEVVVNRPMPGRYYEFGINLHIQ